MRRLLLVTAFVLTGTAGSVVAQEPAFREDLRFVETLRNRGDSDLALEFLHRMARSASPELARELPLELAKTNLRRASEQPETSKRLELYREARDDFQRFITANPGHPRNAEANLDIARVLNLQGKTELNRALLSDDVKTKKDQAAQAQATLQDAAGQLAAAAREIEGQLKKQPDPDTIDDPVKKKEAEVARTPIANDLAQTQFDRGLNLYDQATTFIARNDDEKASDLLIQSKKVLDPLANGDPRQPITWKARAWLGRIIYETETAEKARAKFGEVLNARTVPAAAEGIRLARYFRLPVVKSKPTDEEKKRGVNAIILEEAYRWRADYPRFLNTPEGHGLTFLYAETLLEDADVRDKTAPQVAAGNRALARTLLRELETSENEYTDRARRRKIEAMARQGLFKADLTKLRTFEDYYVRAQFEAIQLMQEQKEGKTDEAARKARIGNIVTALERGLALPEVQKMKASMELNNARTMLAYWALNTGRLDEAIRQGETFARNDPRSSQAEMAAVYALQAYSQLVAQKGGMSDEKNDERGKMLSLAAYMEERWPKSMAGELARHSIGLQMLREENYPEAIKKLGQVTPSYANYPLVCFQLADSCFKAEKASLEPISGDRPGDYRKRAVVALEGMPDSALGPDPFTNQIFVSSKAMLGRELFKLKRFAQMDELAATYLERLVKLRFNDDEDKDRTIRNQLRYELVDVKLFARYGLADAAFQANDFARVVALTDPLVDAVLKSDDSQEKQNMQKNPQLASAVLLLALRSNIQLGKIDRTDQVLDVLDQVTAEGGEGATNVLRLLAFLIRGQVDELRKKGDKEAVNKAVTGYSAILDKRIKKQKNLTPEFIRVLADCYSSMEKHAEAAAELKKALGEPPAAGSPEEKTYRMIQLSLVRELRLSKDPENLKQARQIIDEAMGAPKKPGWGARDILALKEQGQLLQAEEKYADSFAHWSGLTKRLAPQATKGGAPKEHYLECYYNMVYSYLKLGLAKTAQEDRDKAIRTAAQQIVQLERNWPGFGSEASEKRFTELLAQQAALKEQYEALKKK